jgi:DNA-binding PadR family transcriptional regulator
MNKKLLRELLIRSEGMHPTPREVSPELQARCDAILAKHAASKVISESNMIVVLLQILSKGRADGDQIIEKLNEVKVHLELQGDGVIFALLARMEDEELILGEFDEAMTRKTYKVEEKGSALLNHNADSVRNLSQHLALLWN